MNYQIENSLASGSTGKVKRATLNNKSYAIKIIKKECKDERNIIKEIKIHMMLKHQNIVKMYNYYTDSNSYFLVMQLAETELFDLIEAEEGLHPTLIHFYFKQLLSAISYLHEKGIVHRDIKPENILLDKDGNLLLTDFGYSTIFMVKGQKRKMKSIAGSYRYMAPEVLNSDYDSSIDIWSMGILLFVMFTGETLWEMPNFTDEKFSNYVQMRNHNYHPFNKLSVNILKLFKSMCTFDKSIRISIENLKEDNWIKTPSPIEDVNGMCKDKYLLMNYVSPKIVNQISLSQPGMVINRIQKGNMILSQPNFNTFDLPALKRLYIPKDKKYVVEIISEILDSMLVPFEISDNYINFTTVDSNRIELTGEIIIESTDSLCYVSFVRLKGDCFEFKRFFNVLSERLRTIE